jgi:hypothetical protein
MFEAWCVVESKLRPKIYVCVCVYVCVVPFPSIILGYGGDAMLI